MSPMLNERLVNEVVPRLDHAVRTIPKMGHECLDQEIEMEFGDIGTLHDVIASHPYQGHEPAPSEEAARHLDWESFLATHPPPPPQRHPRVGGRRHHT